MSPERLSLGRRGNVHPSKKPLACVIGGIDLVRALALGAQAAFAGKAFLWGLGALWEEGPGHVIDLLRDETRASLGQIGAQSPWEARAVVIRHPGAIAFPRSQPTRV